MQLLDGGSANRLLYQQLSQFCTLLRFENIALVQQLLDEQALLVVLQFGNLCLLGINRLPVDTFVKDCLDQPIAVFSDS